MKPVFLGQSLWLLIPVLAVMAVVPVHSAALNGLVAHRAVYDIKLLDATDRSGIRGMDGRIVYEIAGAPCEGFAVKFRFVSQINTGRKSFVTDQRTTTFEDAKENSFRFLTRSFVNDQFEKEVRGSAKRTSDGTLIAIDKPESRQHHLGKAMFMTEHLARIIDKAQQGETIFTADIFDGSENADELMATTTVIGNQKTGEINTGDASLKILENQPSWPVSISYFSLKDEHRGENLPVYQVSFDLYENGVSGNLRMRYKDYALKGELSKLEILPGTECG